MDAMDTIKTEPEVKENFNETMKPSTSAAPEMSSDDMDRQLRRKVHVSELDGLEGHDRELKWRSYDDEQLEAVTLQLYEQGSYSPKYGGFNDTMPGIEVLEGDEDAKNLLALRQKNRKNPEVVADVGASLRDIALRGMGDDEAIFSAEQKLDPQVHLWADKYRPRKPMYVNRVQTGFDWNKYNQTHYDMDNPPTKFVLGYKFNIFYPDLLNKRTNPDFKIFETEDLDFAILRFTSGPPYEDIAFKIVRREWEVSHKNGYKCQFQNGVFQLWFQLKSMSKKNKKRSTKIRKRVVCTFCDFTYNASSASLKFQKALIVHVCRHIGIEVFQCNDCPACFVSEYSYFAHSLNSHNSTGSFYYVCFEHDFAHREAVKESFSRYFPLIKFTDDWE